LNAKYQDKEQKFTLKVHDTIFGYTVMQLNSKQEQQQSFLKKLHKYFLGVFFSTKIRTKPKNLSAKDQREPRPEVYCVKDKDKVKKTSRRLDDSIVGVSLL